MCNFKAICPLGLMQVIVSLVQVIVFSLVQVRQLFSSYNLNIYIQSLQLFLNGEKYNKKQKTN